MPLIPYSRYRPDNAGLNSPYASDITNVLCSEEGYIPFPALEPFSTAVAAQPLGGITVRLSDGSVHIFVGTAAALYKLNTSTLAWTVVTRTVGGAYAATVDERWRFKVFGLNVVAVNINDAPQVYTINSSTNFAALGGSPPNASNIAVWGDHLALFNKDTRTVTWSDTDNITNWSTLNAGSQTFPDGGELQGSNDATNPIIFQKGAIRFGTFVPGSLEVFTFQKVRDQQGCAAPYSIASRGHFTFFADAGAFYQIQPDGVIIPIGKEKVDRTIFTELSGDSLAAIYGEVDPFHTRVYFAIRVNSTGDTFDTLLTYDWGIGEWTRIDTSMEILFPLAAGTIGYTLDGLDALYADLDAMPISLDSNVFKGGSPVMGALDANFKLGFFSGDNSEATLITQEMGATDGSVQRITELYPVVDVADFSHLRMAYRARMRRTDNFVESAEFTPSTNTGIARKRSRARFHRIKTVISEGANWTSAQGINANAVPAGQR